MLGPLIYSILYKIIPFSTFPKLKMSMNGRFLTSEPTARHPNRMGLVALLLVLVLWGAPSALFAEPPEGTAISTLGEYDLYAPSGDIRRFGGETLKWDIDFLFFSKAATAEVHFYEKNGHYEATLLSETKGVVGFFTSYRKHFYKSVFDVTEDGQRVRTRSFERKVIIGDDVERTTHILDYGTRSHFWFKYKNEKLVENKMEDIPEGVFFDDILAAFYNFRNGVYGDVDKGKKYVINTIPDKSMKDIKIYVHTDGEKENHSDNGNNQIEYLITITIPKDVFKTESGELIFWTSKHLIPLETTIKNYILLGDLHGLFSGGLFKSNNELAKATSSE